MDTTTQNMLALLRISLSGKKPEIPAFTYKEWEDMYWLARKHGVVTMINDAIEMLPPDLQPDIISTTRPRCWSSLTGKHRPKDSPTYCSKA